MGFIGSAQSAVQRGLSAALVPPPRPDITRWCEDNVVFDERSPFPGEFRIDRFPFLREIHEVLSPEHPSREVTIRGSAQWGKTVSVLNPTVAAWHEYGPLDSLVVHPTGSAATEWVRYKWMPMRRQAPSLRAIFGEGRGEQTDTLSNQETLARDGSLKIVSAGSPDDLAGTNVIANAIIGTGIEPKLMSDDEALQADWTGEHLPFLDSTGLDADGINTLAGLERMAVMAMVSDGDAFIVWPNGGGDSPILQLRVLEADYLDDRQQGRASDPENAIFDGIEYGPDGQVVAYHLYEEHPGSAVWHPDWKGMTSSRIPAERVVHLFRADRPGQRRGISWLAPVLEDLVALAENDDAQMMRQKIAACFAAFWKTEKEGPAAGIPGKLAPGMIQKIGLEDEVIFGNPPDVTGYDDFARVHLRRIAAGLGITYEALTGDLTGVNFSSARVGRMEMAANVEVWQWLLVMPRLCQPMGQWFLRSWSYAAPDKISALARAKITWTPPPPAIADPKTETQVATQKIEAGLSSRHAEIRKLGHDPKEIDQEIKADAETRQALSALKAPSQAAALQAEERELDAA